MAHTFPLADLDAVDRLGDDLRAAEFNTTAVPDLLGESAHRALARGEFFAALRATRERSVLATLIRLFLLGSTEPETAVAQALPTLGLDRAKQQGVLEHDVDGWRAALDIRPHADDADEFLVVSDLDSDTRPGPVRPDHVLGIGQASVNLAAAIIRDPVGSVLDLGTGCGIQALHCFSHAKRITATDTNPRALALAAATARLNHQEWDLRRGNLFEPVRGERFDLVVSNPPFVVGPGRQHYEYRDSGMVGDAVCAALVRALPAHLTEGGTGQLLANWIVRDGPGGSDWRDRVGSWLDRSGCDAWVVQRELADPAEYVALWLKDAGEERTGPGEQWLDYFAAEKIVGIGMGVITLRRTDADDPDIVLDEITGAGEEITGDEAAAFLARRSWLRTTSDADLLATTLALAENAILETRALAGHEGWHTVLRLLRRPGGPGALLQLDEWGQSLLAGCTGEVPLIVAIQLLAQAHQVPTGALAEAVLPSIRAGITRGLLHPVS